MPPKLASSTKETNLAVALALQKTVLQCQTLDSDKLGKSQARLSQQSQAQQKQHTMARGGMLGFPKLGRRRAVAAAACYDDALPSLAALAASQRFDEIIEILQFQRKIEPWLCVPGPAKLTALHIVMLYNPPVALVDLLIESLSRLVEPNYVPEATVDIRGQTPLHVAAASGCSLAVIKRLTKMSHHAVLHRDNVGRLPLHYVCCGSNAKDDDTATRTTRRKKKAAGRRRDAINMVHCIHYLVDIYPQACAIRDASGWIPLDLAIHNKADQRVILALLSRTPQTATNTKFGKTRMVTKTPAGSRDAATKSTGKSPFSADNLPLQIVRADSRDQDDVSSVGLRSFYWSPSLRKQQRRSTPVEI